MGFGARDFVHGANAAKPKKLRSPSGRRSKTHFFKKTKKILKNYRKVGDNRPTGATPHGRVAFVRFGAESCAKTARNKLKSWAANKGKTCFQRETKMTSKN